MVAYYLDPFPVGQQIAEKTLINLLPQEVTAWNHPCILIGEKYGRHDEVPETGDQATQPYRPTVCALHRAQSEQWHPNLLRPLRKDVSSEAALQKESSSGNLHGGIEVPNL